MSEVGRHNSLPTLAAYDGLAARLNLQINVVLILAALLNRHTIQQQLTIPSHGLRDSDESGYTLR